MNKAYVIIGAVFLTLAASCSSDDLYQQEPDNVPAESEYVGDVIISAGDFEYEAASRTSFNINGNKAEFLWAENDTVGIFPDKGTQVEFPMSNGAGSNTAAFDGGGWGLKSASTYYAYYPFQRKNYLVADAKTKIPVSYAGQTQTGNGNLNHLGFYDFMAAKGTKPTNGGLNFQFEHLGALIKLTLNIAEPTTLQSITLITDNADFTIDGHIDITVATPSIVSQTKRRTLSIDLNSVSTNSKNEEVVIYFMIAPTNLSSKPLSLSISKDLNKTYELTSKNFQAGHAYELSAIIDNTDPYNDHEYVNLGLPSGLMWATCNIGGDSSSDIGDYFAWGETETKSTYTAENSIWDGLQYFDLYNQGVVDRNYNLTPQYDAATVNWGGNWRMPTYTEFKELINECTWTWSTQNGREGFIVSGLNGNSIFLPTTGYRSNENLKDDGMGYYWSSSTIKASYYSSTTLNFDELNLSTFGRPYHLGQPIRPVAN